MEGNDEEKKGWRGKEKEEGKRMDRATKGEMEEEKEKRMNGQ